MGQAFASGPFAVMAFFWAALALILLTSACASAAAAGDAGRSARPNILYIMADDHAAHAKREKNDCKVCHPGLFQQSAKAPLNFKAGMHKPAEAKKISCGNCHHPGGKAFETKGNCAKCHVKAAAKPAAKG